MTDDKQHVIHSGSPLHHPEDLLHGEEHQHPPLVQMSCSNEPSHFALRHVHELLVKMISVVL